MAGPTAGTPRVLPVLSPALVGEPGTRPVPALGGAPGTGPPAAPHSGRWLATYLVAQTLMITGMLAVPGPLRLLCVLLVVLCAATALAVPVIRTRPAARAAWGLITCGAALTGLATAGLVATIELPGHGGWLVPSDLIRLAGYGVMTAGLLGLGRASDRAAGVMDLIDAGVVASGTFLVLWAVLLAPAVGGRIGQPPGMLLATLVADLLVLAVIAKLAFNGGLRTGTGILVSVGSLAIFAAPIISVLTVPHGVRWPGRLLVFGGLAVLGAVGLAGRLGRPGIELGQRRDLSGMRVGLFAALTLVGPYAWLVSVYRGGERHSDLDVIAPVVAFAILVLLLLVGRLAMTARLAQRRATDLATQTTELGRAVREQRDLQHQLSYRALHDPLTGLANRVVLNERMERALGPGADGHVVLLLDLDGFKDINDTYGHPVGDEVLVAVGRRLFEVVPPEGTLARLGGDEFAVFLTAAGESGWELAEWLRRSIVQPFPVEGHELFLTASIGLYQTRPGEQATPATALRDADVALYAAKDNGKNRVVRFSPELRRAWLGRTSLRAGLRGALARRELSLRYQPVVDLRDGRIIAVEALLRWTRADGQQVAPAEFIPIAEETGDIHDLGRWALRTACQQARPWFAEHQVTISVNVSARQLDLPDFADEVIGALDAAGLPGRALIVELTETSMMSLAGEAVAMATLDRLRGRGVRVAVDDFGTGYSSLSYVSRLPVDIVKLDGSFAGHGTVPGQSDGWSFVRAILALVDTLGLTTVAEGIESQAQATALRELGCPLGQGYLFAAPLAAADVPRHLSRLVPAEPTPAA